MNGLAKEDILLGVVNYNQVHEIGPFLHKLIQKWPAKQIIFVDDGSTDGSCEVPEKMGLAVRKHAQNLGVGAAIRSVILEAMDKGYKAVLIMSSNGKMESEEIPRVIGPLLDGSADYVTGSRFLSGGSSPGLSPFRNWAIPLFSLMCVPLLGRYFSDITCGYRAYKIDLFTEGSCDIHQEWLNRYELEYYVHYWACKTKRRIVEVPVTIHYTHLQKTRQSKIRPVLDWWSMIRPFVFLRFGIKK